VNWKSKVNLFKLRRSGLYQCTQCHWYFIKTGRQWRGAFWHANAVPGPGLSKMIEGYVSRIELQEYPDCIRHMRRI